MKRLLLLASLFTLPGSQACAQSPRRSQRAEIMQMVGDTEIRAMYIRPVARGRALFGALVPHGKVWTPSADSRGRYFRALKRVTYRQLSWPEGARLAGRAAWRQTGSVAKLGKLGER